MEAYTMIIANYDKSRKLNKFTELGFSVYSPTIELWKVLMHEQIFPTHVHDMFVIGVVLDGVLAIGYRGNQYLARAGDIFLINHGIFHTGQSACADGVKFYYILIPAQLIQNHFGDYLHLNEPVSMKDWQLATRLIQYFEIQALRDAVLTQQETHKIIARLLFLIRPLLSKKTTPTLIADSRMQTIDFKIKTSLNMSISVAELAATVGLSRFHFLRIFKKHFGTTPHSHIQALRIAKAKRLIANGLAPIDAAIATGYVDQSHMSRWMKNCYGVTPTTYYNHRCALG